MKVIILVGTPGAGKSTIAKTQFGHMTRINQDELGSRDRCLKLCNEALARGEDVIIDRCNHTLKQRNEWTKMARIYNASVHCIYLDIGTQFAAKRIAERENHPTIQGYSLARCLKLVVKFNSEFQVPTMDENFDSLLHIRVK